MNKIRVSYGQTVSPRQFESRRYDVEIESEVTTEPAEEAQRLFAQCRQMITEQKQVDGNENKNIQ